MLALRYDLHFTAYPGGFWSFNPFAWQLLFVFGAWCALGGAKDVGLAVLAGHALDFVCLSARIVLRDPDLVLPAARHLMPHWIER